MNLDKAIEIKQRTGVDRLNTDPDEIDQAEALSIEALKCIIKDRECGYFPQGHLLPGETLPEGTTPTR